MAGFLLKRKKYRKQLAVCANCGKTYTLLNSDGQHKRKYCDVCKPFAQLYYCKPIALRTRSLKDFIAWKLGQI